MLNEPIPCQPRRRFRISERVKGAGDGHFVVANFHQRVVSKSWHPAEDRDETLLHILDHLLFRPRSEVVFAYNSIHGFSFQALGQYLVPLSSSIPKVQAFA